MLDIDTGVAEARTLHPSSQGFFATLRKRPNTRATHRMYRLDRLEDFVRVLDKTNDVYVSQASFVTDSRTAAAFKSINCAFVDIDCYKEHDGKPGIVPDQAFIDRLHANARAAGLPEPSYTTFSGRGVYCKWIFDKPISAHQMLRWQALQEVLVPLYTAFGVDASVKDVSRVLRIVGSTHSGSTESVRIATNTNVRHDFEMLCKAAQAVDLTAFTPAKTAGKALAGAAAAERVIQRIKKNVAALNSLDPSDIGNLQLLTDYQARNEPVMLQRGSRDFLNWSRFVDLRTLAELRGGILPGSRDLMLFWMATSLAHAGVLNSSTLEVEMSGLIGAFSGPDFNPIQDGSLSSVVQRLRDKEEGRKVHFEGGTYDPLYTATNAHLIDVLGITPEEQEKMVTIIDTQEKRRRADLKVEGRAERRVERIESRARAVEMAAECEARGETRFIAKIAKALDIDRSQVSRLLAGKLERDPKRPETRGRKKVCKSGGMIPIVVERLGSLTRKIWVPGDASAQDIELLRTQAEKEAAVAIAKAMGPGRAVSGSAGSSAWSSRFTPSVSPFKTLVTADQPLDATKRVILSVSRKGREGEAAFAREEGKGRYSWGAPAASRFCPDSNLTPTEPGSQPSTLSFTSHPVSPDVVVAAGAGGVIRSLANSFASFVLLGTVGPGQHRQRNKVAGSAGRMRDQAPAQVRPAIAQIPAKDHGKFWPATCRPTPKVVQPKVRKVTVKLDRITRQANGALSASDAHWPARFINRDGRFMVPKDLTREDLTLMSAEQARVTKEQADMREASLQHARDAEALLRNSLAESIKANFTKGRASVLARVSTSNAAPTTADAQSNFRVS